MRALQQHAEFLTPGGIPGEEVLDGACAQLKSTYDATYGGFGGAPKFPPSMSLSLLLRRYVRRGDQRALEIAEHTLKCMARGGMYDQLGGGVHRYSVDERWLVPHFEKMLYDNALLVSTYLEAYQATQDEFYRRGRRAHPRLCAARDDAARRRILRGAGRGQRGRRGLVFYLDFRGD